MNRIAVCRLLGVGLLLALAALGCNLPVGVPRATPTLAPTHTPSHTPVVTPTALVLLPTFTPTSTPTATATATPTVTLSATATASATVTPSLTATLTSTATATPTMTGTYTATATATQTSTATDTPEPTATTTLTASATLTVTVTLTATATNSATPIPTNTPTAVPPSATATVTSSATPAPTRTPVPPSATATVTSSVTPRPVTATPVPPTLTPTLLPTVTPAPSVTPLVLTVQSFPVPTVIQTPVITRVPDLGILPTSTPRPATPTLAPTATPPPQLPPPVSAGALPTPLPTGVFPGLGATPLEGGSSAALETFLVDPGTLAVYPPDASLSALVDVDFGPEGMVAAAENADPEHPGYGLSLRIGEELLEGSPLPSATIRFTRVRWSPDGSRLAFLAETPGADGDGSARIGDTPSDGLWVWTLAPGEETQFTKRILENRYEEDRGRDVARVIRDFAWSPDGTRLLVQQERAEGFPGQLGLITPDWNDGDDPAEIRHEYGSWSQDGQRILVSGMQTDVGPVLGWVNPADLTLDPILDGGANNLWMQAAVELRDGRIAFFGATTRDSGDFGLYTLSDGSLSRGAALGGPLADVAWNAARSAAIVRLTDGRTLIVEVAGGVRDVTGMVGAGALAWAE